jgi:hypothetical protein
MTDNPIGSKINELDLSRNKLNGSDLKALLELIKKNGKYFKILNLRDNLLRDQMCEEIVNALKFNTYIVKCNLDLNPVKHVVLKEIETLTKRNLESLKEVETP